MPKKTKKTQKFRALRQPRDDLRGRMRGVTTIFLALILAVFLFFNIIQSQNLSSLYFQLVNEDKKAAVGFLKKIKALSPFKNFLEINKNIYGNAIKEEVFSEEKERNLTIKNLEQILEKNPKTRDVLYGLYLLNADLGNKIQAEEYLRRAREVDPTLK